MVVFVYRHGDYVETSDIFVEFLACGESEGEVVFGMVFFYELSPAAKIFFVRVGGGNEIDSLVS